MAQIIITPEVLNQINQSLAKQLTGQLSPQGVGFCVFLFKSDAAGKTRIVYSSNCDRKDIVHQIGGWVDTRRKEALEEEAEGLNGDAGTDEVDLPLPFPRGES